MEVSRFIAPPYDVLDEGPKQALLARCDTNIVKIDLPFTPPKTVGPNEVYAQAGATYRNWLETGVLKRNDRPAVYIYQQSYTHDGKTFARRGVIANMAVTPFSPGSHGLGGVFAHEKTFSSGKEDRLKLMRATKAQLSPIFGIYSDEADRIGPMLAKVADSRQPNMTGVTDNDHVRHEVWVVDDPDEIAKLCDALSGYDIFIADGHHRYNTAINYQKETPGEAARRCMFVFVAMQDPGMIVLPTHRVVRNLRGFDMGRLEATLRGHSELAFTPTQHGADGLAALEKELPGHKYHAMGLYDPATRRTAILSTRGEDPLSALLPERVKVWRTLGVAVLHELVMERVLKPTFTTGGDELTFKYTAQLPEFRSMTEAQEGSLGVIVQPTPLDAVRGVSEAGELMPQKSTYFFPKLATGLVINPLDI